jgi:leucyl-tRNA synthetase
MVLKDGHKMSNSVGNVVDPNHLINTYGADTARLFVMFAAPPEQSLEWSDTAVEGAHRFLKRLWYFAHLHATLFVDVNDMILGGNGHIDWQHTENRLKKSRNAVHHILAQANNDYERNQFNTVVSGCMKLFNEMSNYELKTDEDKLYIHSCMSIVLRLLAPITPHICHYLWQHLGFEKAIIDAHWPKVDKNALKTEEADFVVQINGKLRAQFTASVELCEEDLIELAKQHAQEFLTNLTVKKAIVVAHRQLINLVAG